MASDLPFLLSDPTPFQPAIFRLHPFLCCYISCITLHSTPTCQSILSSSATVILPMLGHVPFQPILKPHPSSSCHITNVSTSPTLLQAFIYPVINKPHPSPSCHISYHQQAPPLSMLLYLLCHQWAPPLFLLSYLSCHQQAPPLCKLQFHQAPPLSKLSCVIIRAPPLSDPSALLHQYPPFSTLASPLSPLLRQTTPLTKSEAESELRCWQAWSHLLMLKRHLLFILFLVSSIFKLCDRVHAYIPLCVKYNEMYIQLVR